MSWRRQFYAEMSNCMSPLLAGAPRVCCLPLFTIRVAPGVRFAKLPLCGQPLSHHIVDVLGSPRRCQPGVTLWAMPFKPLSMASHK